VNGDTIFVTGTYKTKAFFNCDPALFIGKAVSLEKTIIGAILLRQHDVNWKKE